MEMLQLVSFLAFLMLCFVLGCFALVWVGAMLLTIVVGVYNAVESWIDGMGSR